MKRLESAPQFRIWREKVVDRFLIREQDTDWCQDRYVIVFETLPCGEEEAWRSDGFIGPDGSKVFPQLPKDFPIAELNDFLIESFVKDCSAEQWDVYTHETISVGMDHDYDPQQVNIYFDESNVRLVVYNLKTNKYTAIVETSYGNYLSFESTKKPLSVSILKTFLEQL